MSLAAYRLMHLFGIFSLLTVLAGACVHAMRGGTLHDRASRLVARGVHGVALALVITGGFGMLARLGYLQDGLPMWVLFKLGIWFTLAAALWFPYSGPRSAKVLLVALPILALLAGATALLKPF